MNSNPEQSIVSKIKNNLTSRNTLKNLAGFAVGAIGGYIYYRTIGCSSGGCAITSNPYLTMLWGGLLGYLLADIFKFKNKVNGSEKEEITEA